MFFLKFMFLGWIIRGLEVILFLWMSLLFIKLFLILLNLLFFEVCLNIVCFFELFNFLVFRLFLLEVCFFKEIKNCEDFFDSWFLDDVILEVFLFSGAKNCDLCVLFVGDFGIKIDLFFVGWLIIFFIFLILMFFFI